MTEKPFIDPWDVMLLEKWLKLARKEGTKAVRITAAPDEICAYRVWVSPEFDYQRK